MINDLVSRKIIRVGPDFKLDSFEISLEKFQSQHPLIVNVLDGLQALRVLAIPYSFWRAPTGRIDWAVYLRTTEAGIVAYRLSGGTFMP